MLANRSCAVCPELSVHHYADTNLQCSGCSSTEAHGVVKCITNIQADTSDNTCAEKYDPAFSSAAVSLALFFLHFSAWFGLVLSWHNSGESAIVRLLFYLPVRD